MRIPALALFGLAVGALPALAQNVPLTPQQMQQQSNQELQAQHDNVTQNLNQQQTQMIEDQQRRDQLFAVQPPLPLPAYKPPPPPPAYKPPPPVKTP